MPPKKLVSKKRRVKLKIKPKAPEPKLAKAPKKLPKKKAPRAAPVVVKHKPLKSKKKSK